MLNSLRQRVIMIVLSLIVSTASADVNLISSCGSSSVGCPKIKWVKIPSGSFNMGSNDRDSFDWEKPIHEVEVSSFWMAETEVTVAQYRKCVEAGACTEPVKYNSKHIWKRYCTWGKSGVEDHPINCITWVQARTFSVWVGGELPTEAQWEYAARGGQTFYYAGSDHLNDVGWYTSNTKDSGPQSVKGKDKNGFGLYDMSGNVWEWVLDEWHFNYKGAPKNGDQPWVCSTQCDEKSSRRVSRGGCWHNDTRTLSVTNREYNDLNQRFNYLGFRVARK